MKPLNRRDFGKASALCVLGAAGLPAARTIPIGGRAPLPVRARIKRLGGSTAVIRRWRPGEAALCRRCPRCDADGDQCTVLVDFPVSPAEAWDLETRGVPYQG